jgi:uncharacterized repeat protein (TIGR03803 family)
MNKRGKYCYLLIAVFVTVVWVASSFDWLTVTASNNAALSRLRAAGSPGTGSLRIATANTNSPRPAQSNLDIRYSGNLIQGSDGYVYGAATTIEDHQNSSVMEQWGAIVRLSESGDFTILHSFNRSDGAFPAGSLIEARDGFLYGVTSEGGENGKGTIFRLRLDGREFLTLYNFKGAEDGAAPLAGLIEDQGGNLGGLYGTTSQGGEKRRGTIYRVSTGGDLKVLHTFADGEGAHPSGVLLISVDGYVYGTTRQGGRGSRGTIFKLRTDGAAFQTIHEFKERDGAGIDSQLIEGADSWLYGVAAYGGFANQGTLFRLQKDGSTFELIHSFNGQDQQSANTRDGIHPLMVLLASDGYLYGTTLEGGQGDRGVVYRVRPAGSEYEVMYSFGGAGDDPRTGLIAATDGKVYLPVAQSGAAREIGAVSQAGQSGDQSSLGLATTQSTLTVNNLNDSGGGSLRDAIYNANWGDKINITVNGTLTLTTGELAIGKSLTITGPGSNLLTVNGNNRSRVFLIMPGSIFLPGPTVTISGLTIANGLAQGGAGGCGGSGGGGAAGLGGGMFIGKGATATLKNLFFQNNSAVGGNGGAGNGCGSGGPSGGGGGGGFGMTNGAGNAGSNGDGRDGGSGGQGGSLGGQGSGGSKCNSGGLGGLGGGGGGGGADNYPYGFDSPCLAGYGNNSSFGGGGGGGGGVVGKFGGSGRFGGGGGGGGSRDGDAPGTGGYGYGAGGNGGGCTECGGGGGGGAGLGGGLFVWSEFFETNSQTTVNLVDCSFTGNSVQAGTGGTGGGGAGNGHDAFAFGPDAYFMESETLSECSTLNQIFNRCYFERSLVIHHLPEPYATITGPSQVCANTSYTSSVSDMGAGATYDWSLTNGTLTGGQGTRTITYTTGSLPQYQFTGVYVTITAGNGCSVTNTAYFYFSPPPSITGPTQVCPNSSGHSASVPDAGSGATYSWTIGNGSITAGLGTREITFSAGTSGSITLTVTVSVPSGCPLTGTKDIPLSNGTDPVNVEITYIKAGSCPNSTGNTASVPDSGPNLTYFWTITGGTITGGQATREVTFTNGTATTVTVSVAITKPSGCATTLSVPIDFTIPVAPVISCPPEELLYTADQGTNGAVVNYTLPAANNYCGGVSVDCVPPPGSIFPIGNTNGPNFHLGGPTFVTCTSTDSQGTTLHCSFKVGVLSRNAQFTQRATSITVNADPGACSAAINLRTYFQCTGAPQPVVKFKYGDSAFAQSFETSSPVSFPVGTTTIYVFATNGVTLADGRYPATITVNDLTPPTINCPANITAQSPAGACSAIVNYTVTATDSNCPSVNVVSYPPSGSAFPIGTTTVTSTATDSSGNQSSCSFTVTVTDVSPPSITCPANITVPNDAGSCSAAVNFNVLASDQCSPVMIVSNPPSGSAFPLGTTTVTSTATDDSGNSRTCMFTVTVRDTTPPDINCPGDVTRSAEPGSCSALVSYTVTSSDNCSNASVVCSPSSGGMFPKGSTSVSCTATDGSGNTKRCSFSVTITDTEAPKSCVTPPSGMVSWWSGDGNANDLQGGNNGILQNSASATAVGRVGQAFSFNGVNDYVTVANHATLNGLSSATIDAWIKLNTVGGRQAIVSKVPVGEYYLLINNGRLSFENNNVGSGAFTGATQLSPNVWYHVAVSYDGANTRLYVNGLEDGVRAGAWSSANSQPLSIGQRGDNSDFLNGFIDEVEIFNRALPVTEIQNIYSAGGFGKCKPVVANSAPGQCSAVVNYNAPSFSDNCTTGSMNCSPASGTTFLKGVTSVSCTVLDAAGNSFANAFVVKVNDAEAPMISCPSPVVVSTDSGQCSAIVNYTPPTPTDNCTTVNTVCAPAPGYAFPKGVTDVTCTATDGMGNTTSCTFAVTVNDTQAPSITCPTPITHGTDPNVCTAVVTFAPTLTDNCALGANPIVCSPASGSTFQKGVTTVSCTATDTSNNTSNCTFTVTVNDTQAPSITCPSPITQPATTGQCSKVVTYSNATATDNCPNVGTPSCLPASGATFQKGVTTVTCTATDASNNPASCTFTVTITDTQPPTITAPANVTKATDPNQCAAAVSYPAPVVSDNCPGTGAPTCSPASGSAFPKGTTTVACLLKDSSNNMSMCSFTVTVNDTQPPVFPNGCAAVITKSAQATCPFTTSLMVSYTTPIATDNCGAVPTVVCTPPSGSTFPLGTTTVACMATDSSGNTAVCTFPVNLYSFCLQDDSSEGNVVFVNAATGAYLFCQNGVPLASGTGTLTVRGCTFQIDTTKGDRKVHIQGDASVNAGTGAGTAYIQKIGGGIVVQITDRKMSDDGCVCGPLAPPPAGKSRVR